jgi:hypothetical protein
MKRKSGFFRMAAVAGLLTTMPKAMAQQITVPLEAMATGRWTSCISNPLLQQASCRSGMWRRHLSGPSAMTTDGNWMSSYGPLCIVKLRWWLANWGYEYRQANRAC